MADASELDDVALAGSDGVREQLAGAALLVADHRVGLHRVVVVEHDPEAIEAADGQEALDSLERMPCGVMLLDLNMPGMNGFEVLERLPRHRSSTRVVFLTSAAAQDVGGALRNGHYYLPKGASRDQLSLLLQSLEA